MLRVWAMDTLIIDVYMQRCGEERRGIQSALQQIQAKLQNTKVIIRNLGESTVKLQVLILQPELRRIICLHSTQTLFYPVLLASLPSALLCWPLPLLAYLHEAEGGMGCIAEHNTVIAAFKRVHPVIQQILAALLLWELLGVSYDSLCVEMGEEETSSLICTSSHPPHPPVPHVPPLPPGDTHHTTPANPHLANGGDTSRSMDKRQCLTQQIQEIWSIACLDQSLLSIARGSALLVDAVDERKVVLHGLANCQPSRSLLSAFRDVAVLVFGCGFGSSLQRNLLNMVLGLSAVTRFPAYQLCKPYVYFPHPIAWQTYKRARAWHEATRVAMAQALKEGSPWALKAHLATVLYKRRIRTEGGAQKTAFCWKPQEKLAEGGYCAPFGHPPVRPLPYHPDERTRLAHQLVHAQASAQFHSNPAVLYCASILEAALAYLHLAKSVAKEGAHGTAGEAGWSTALTLEDLRSDTIVRSAGLELPQRNADDLASQPGALYLEAARLLYFLLQLQRNPSYSDEIAAKGYEYFPDPMPSGLNKDGVQVVPGDAAGVEPLLRSVWLQLFRACLKTGSPSLCASIGEAACVYFETQGDIQGQCEVQGQLESFNRGTTSKMFLTPNKIEKAVRVHEVLVLCPKWPGRVTSWSSGNVASSLVELGMRDEDEPISAWEKGPEKTGAFYLGAVESKPKVLFKRGRSHVFHIDSERRPCTVEEVVLHVFTEEVDIADFLLGSDSSSMFIDATGKVKTGKTVAAGDKRGREGPAKLVYYPSVLFSSGARYLLPPVEKGVFGHPQALKQVFHSALEDPTMQAATKAGFIPLDAARRVCEGLDADWYKVDVPVGYISARVQPWIPSSGTGWRGAHGENVLWGTVYGLLMWDCIAALPPAHMSAKVETISAAVTASALQAAWKHPWQTMPLDVLSSGFYTHRRTLIDVHLERLCSMSRCELASYVYRIYEERLGSLAWRIRWDLFDPDDLAELVHAAGGDLICTVLRSMSQGYQYNFSGLPDIILWKPTPCPRCKFGLVGFHETRGLLVDYHAGCWKYTQQTGQAYGPPVFTAAAVAASSAGSTPVNDGGALCVMVEVKSKNDRVQPHQLAWFERLNKKVAMVVAHVHGLPEDN